MDIAVNKSAKDSSADYHELNAGAHRNSPKNLTAPTLVWHIGSWIDAVSIPNETDADSSVARRIDDFILQICRKQSESGIMVELLPNVSSKVLLFSTIADPTTFAKRDDLEAHLLPRERDIYKSSMRCVTAKFKRFSLNFALRFEIHTELISMTMFVELAKGKIDPPFSSDDHINSMISTMLNCLNSSDGQQSYIEASEYFFSDFWKLTEENIFPRALSDAIFEGVFADFRGIIFSEKVIKSIKFDSADVRRKSSWGGDAKKRLLPLLKTHLASRLREYESAVNYMLDGRALYLSTLAPQLPDASISERIPVRYIILVQSQDAERTIVNSRQLGRLINLLHHLGMARLAALRDIKALREVGQQLSRLDVGLQQAREAIATDDATAMRNIQTAHSEFNAISRKFVLTRRYGILYRIERSRYYVEQFRKGQKNLRIRRFEGDQPYNKFVERRLGSQYDFIDRVGIRYERAARNVSTLDQNYLSIKTAKLGEEAASINREIGTIQRWGEFFLFLILLPYYFTHLVEMILQKELMPYVALFTWGAFGIAAFTRLAKSRGLFGSMVVAILVLFTFMVVSRSNLDCSWALKICRKQFSAASSQPEISQRRSDQEN